MRYDKEVRRQMAKLINEKGLDFAAALEEAYKDTEIREIFLIAPTVQAALSAAAPPPPWQMVASVHRAATRIKGGGGKERAELEQRQGRKRQEGQGQ